MSAVSGSRSGFGLDVPPKTVQELRERLVASFNDYKLRSDRLWIDHKHEIDEMLNQTCCDRCCGGGTALTTTSTTTTLPGGQQSATSTTTASRAGCCDRSGAKANDKTGSLVCCQCCDDVEVDAAVATGGSTAVLPANSKPNKKAKDDCC